jgi:hypothetical protein
VFAWRREPLRLDFPFYLDRKGGSVIQASRVPDSESRSALDGDRREAFAELIGF